jgi:Protein of unknown function (DUF2591)
MKIKTNELTDRALDWAVERALGTSEFWFAPDEFKPQYESGESHYSTDWSQGGPIIEREKITSLCIDNDWCAVKGIKYAVTGREPDTLIRVFGPTPLVAAMRCYVASKLGDIIDIPEELK